MFSEDDLQPISALQHLAFCERQWALIHLEKVWTESVLTAEGRHLHERTHEPDTEQRGDVRIARGLRLRSLRLGLSGQADVVEFHKIGALTTEAQRAQEKELGSYEDGHPSSAPSRVSRGASSSTGVALPGVDGLWRVFPVEYKRGRPKRERWDEYQLCAQALCLEEMLGCTIEAGALFYGQTRRRHDVDFSKSLRMETETLAARLHELVRAGRTPPARYEKKCESCSLVNLCLPRLAEGNRSAKRYLDDILKAE